MQRVATAIFTCSQSTFETYNYFSFAGVDPQRYLGCYRDGPVNGRRVMSYPLGAMADTDDMTVNSCLATCRQSSHTYAGLEVLRR